MEVINHLLNGMILQVRSTSTLCWLGWFSQGHLYRLIWWFWPSWPPGKCPFSFWECWDTVPHANPFSNYRGTSHDLYVVNNHGSFSSPKDRVILIISYKWMVTPLTNHLLNGMILHKWDPPQIPSCFFNFSRGMDSILDIFKSTPQPGCQSPPSSHLAWIFHWHRCLWGWKGSGYFFFLPPDSGTHHLIPRFFLDFLLTKLVGSLERKRSFSNQWKFPAIRKHEKKSIVWMISAVSKMLFGTVMAGQRTPPGPRTPPRNSRPY